MCADHVVSPWDQDAGLKSGATWAQHAVPLQREQAGRKAGVEGGGLELEIEHQAIVQKFLNMEGDLSAVDRTVVGEANFNRNVEKGVIVRVDVESEGDGEVGVGIEEDVGLAEMLHQGGAITGERGELLRRDDMDDGLAVVSFRADIGDDGVWGGEQAGQGKSGEPAGVVEEI